MNISFVSEELMCSNCGACNSICPVNAIDFKQSTIGRLYASVSQDTCVDCGLCVKVCPSIDYNNVLRERDNQLVGEIKEAFVGKSANEAIFKNAQNGGTCTATLLYLFEKGLIDCALVCKMQSGKTPEATPVIVTNPLQLKDCQKSCYTPVDMLSALKICKKYNSVAIVGLPCHIQGVELLMRQNKFSNIRYRLGLICDRTLCAGILDVFMSFLPGKEANIIWRKKDFTDNGRYYSYVSAPVVIETSEGERKILPKDYRISLKDMFTAPRCRVCVDKLNYYADIVFGDPWGIPDTDDQHGESLLFARTDKGLELIQNMLHDEKVILRNVDIKSIIDGQHIKKKQEQTAVYSKAIRSLNPDIKSYLCHQYEDYSIGAKELADVQKNLTDFISREKKSKDEVIEIAKNEILKQNKKSCLPVRLVGMVKAKLSYEIRNIWRKFYK